MDIIASSPEHRAVSMANQLQLQVRQPPHDLLVHPSESESPPAARSGRLGVEAWQDEHGELFFKDASVASRVFVPTPYGLDSRVHTNKSRVDDLKRALVKYLWWLKELEDWSIRDLFRQIRSSSRCPAADEALSCIDFASFAEFIDRRGFHNNRPRASRQEWFAVLKSIQELSITSTTGITFGALRTAMLDPFHMSFWDHYAHCLLQPGRSCGFILDILYQTFRPTLPSRDSRTATVYWREFLGSLVAFHTAIGFPEPTPSENCRLLYRFDSLGTGEIDVTRFLELIRIKLVELWTASETPKRLLPIGHNEGQATAVLNSRWRPNVEGFTTAKAVRNLFAARARAASYELDKVATASTSSPTSRLDKVGFGVEMALLEEGNSRLARITSLPVTRLLR